jgi:hypothetical protein
MARIDQQAYRKSTATRAQQSQQASLLRHSLLLLEI